MQMYADAVVFDKIQIPLKAVYFRNQWTLDSTNAIICGTAKFFGVNDGFL
jgi:hypothetical protein